MKRVDNRCPIGRGGLWRPKRAAGPALPVLESAPVLTGTPVIGQMLACTTGAWSGTGALSHARQWMRDGAAIGGATGETYVLTAADDLSEIACVVTATDANGSRSAASNAVGVTFAAPVAAGGIEDRIFTIGAAIAPVDVAADFTGESLTFTLAPSSAALPAGLSLSPEGFITGTPTAVAEMVTIVVRGTNSGGFADSGFDLTIATAIQAPVLSGFSVASNGSGAGTMSLTVDTDCTIHTWIGPVGTLPDAAEVRAGTGAAATFSFSATTASGSFQIAIPNGLSGDYRVALVGQIGDGPLSNVVTQSPVAFDSVAASLSGPTATQTGQTTAVWGVTSDEAGGAIHAGIRPAASAPLTAAQLIAGAGGAGLAWSSDATPTADANNGGSFSGLTAGTAYRVDILQVDANGNEGGVITTAEFLTAPSVLAAVNGQSASVLATGTSHSVAMPDGVQAGDRLIVTVMGANLSAAAALNFVETSGNGWTEYEHWRSGTSANMVVFTKIATGSDALTFTTDATFGGNAIAQRVSNPGGFTPPAFANGLGTAPNPPWLDAGSSADRLWFAVAGSSGAAANAAYPADYTEDQFGAQGGSLGRHALATRILTAQSEDPDAFTISANSNWLACTMAVARS